MQRESGQAVLIIVLSMVVALTVVLSVIASSTSDIKIGSNDVASQRAFSAAESGIEKALITNANIPTSTINGATYNTSIAGLAQGQNNFNFPLNLVSGDHAVLWFVSHNVDGTIGCTGPCFTGHTVKVCWGNPGTSSSNATTPAIEISAFYLATPSNYTTAKVVKAVYDPNGGRRGANSYQASDAGNCTIGTTQYAFQKQIDLASLGIPAGSYGATNGLQFMPIKILYNTDAAHPVGVTVAFAGNSSLPSQGNLVDSTGNLNTATRKVEVTRVYNQAPPVFDVAVYSPNSLTQ